MKLTRIHSWLEIKNNLGIATFYLAILGVVFGGLWEVLTYIHPNQAEKSSPNSNTFSGNTFNNSSIKIEQNTFIGYTIEQFRKSLNEELVSKQKDWERANGAEKAAISRQLSSIQGKLLNLQKSYEEAKAEIQRLNLALNESKAKNPKIAAQQFIDAQSATQNGDYSKADALFKDIENAADAHIANAANAAYQRAKIANNSYRWSDALELANKAQRLEPKNEVYLSFYANMLLNSGDSLKAQKLYEQSLQLAINKYGANSLEAGNQHNSLGLSYTASNFTLAESHILKAIEIAKFPRKAASINNLSLGNLYSNIANLYLINGNYLEAESNHLKAIAVHKKVLPADYQDLALDYNNLGIMYIQERLWGKAEINLLKAIAIDEKYLPVGHPSLPRHYITLANIYLAQGSRPIDKVTFLKVKPILLKTNAIYLKYPPINQEELGMSNWLLATLYFDIGDLATAEPFYKLAADIAGSVYGLKDDMTLNIISEYLICLKNQGKDTMPIVKKYGLAIKPVNN